MADSAALSAAFESQRPHLLRIAYGTLGLVADAEDVVQEAWLRLSRLPDPDQIEDLRAWLTRVVGRLALDALRRARRTREQHVCEWLPEPVVHDGVGTADLADRVTLDESVTTAPLVVLESLSPAERTAFVLHDVFGMPFEEMGQVVGRTPAAVALAGRPRRPPRRRAASAQPGHARGPSPRRGAFALACAEGDLEAPLATLDEEVIWRSDGGGHAATGGS